LGFKQFDQVVLYSAPGRGCSHLLPVSFREIRCGQLDKGARDFLLGIVQFKNSDCHLPFVPAGIKISLRLHRDRPCIRARIDKKTSASVLKCEYIPPLYQTSLIMAMGGHCALGLEIHSALCEMSRLKDRRIEK
jgi:hypothetical protein